MATLNVQPSAASMFGNSIHPGDSASQFSQRASSGQLSVEESVLLFQQVLGGLLQSAYLAGANAGVNAGLVAGMNTAFDVMSNNSSMLTRAPTESSVRAESDASTAQMSVAPPASIALTEEARQPQRVDGATPGDDGINKEEEDAVEELGRYFEAQEARQKAEATPQSTAEAPNNTNRI